MLADFDALALAELLALSPLDLDDELLLAALDAFLPELALPDELALPRSELPSEPLDDDLSPLDADLPAPSDALPEADELADLPAAPLSLLAAALLPELAELDPGPRMGARLLLARQLLAPLREGIIPLRIMLCIMALAFRLLAKVRTNFVSIFILIKVSMNVTTVGVHPSRN